jgi:hypothetical protein
MEWIDWGAVTVFIAVLLIVLFITLADPVIRLIRLELRYKGKQEEKILEAKTAALDSQKLQAAMEERADIEADELATQILNQAATTSTPTYRQSTIQMPRQRPGYVNNQSGYGEQGAGDPKGQSRPAGKSTPPRTWL